VYIGFQKSIGRHKGIITKSYKDAVSAQFRHVGLLVCSHLSNLSAIQQLSPLLVTGLQI
jgi:hypothetical protein